MSSRDNNNNNSRQRRDRQPRRNRNNDDLDAAFKEQIKAERRAQVIQNVNDQDHQESNDAMIGDNMVAGNVSSVPRSSNNGRERGTGSSSSRSGRARGQNRPAKGGSKANPAQVGAVATTGRAFGAPRRPPTGRNNETRSIAGDGHYESSDEEAPRHAKEAVAMNAMTVEDHEREKRRQRKVQEEASRLTQEIKDESRKKKAKKKPYEKEMAFVVAEKDEDHDDNVYQEDHSPNSGTLDSSRRWKKIAMCLGCTLVLVVIGVVLVFTLRTAESQAGPNIVDTPNPTAIASTVPSNAPSHGPSETPIVYKYPFPTDEECAIIANGLTLDWEERYESRMIEVTMDVQVWEQDPEIQVPIQQEHIQKFLMPKLAGCQDAAYGNAALAQAGNRRHLQDGDPRNVVANGLVAVRINELGICDETRSRPCYVVVALLDLSLLGDERYFTLLFDIIKPVFDEVNKKLKGILELDAPFVEVTVTDVGSFDPTPVPSASPSASPSSFITSVPSNNPTPNPSGAPTL